MNKKRFIKRNLLIFFIFLTIASACEKKESLSVENADNLITGPISISEETLAKNNSCNNLFYPLALDNYWIYEIQGGEVSGGPAFSEQRLTVTEVNDSSTVLAALDENSGIVTKSSVDCRDGAILNFPMTELSLLFGQAAGNIQLTYESGLFMPSEDDFIAGNWTNTWKTEFSANGTVSGVYDNNTASVSLSNSPVIMEWQFSDKDLSLQGPTGTHDDVVLIKRKITFDISSLKATIRGQALDISTTLIIKTNMWYAPGIGLLKQEIDSATIKLFGINFPIDPIGLIELKSSNLIK